MSQTRLSSYFNTAELNQETPVSLEETLLGFEQTYREYSDIEERHDELTFAIEGLGSVVESLQATMQQGGLSQRAASFAYRAVDGYGHHLGFYSSGLLPSLESYGHVDQRLVATTVSIESIDETIKRILKAIWEKVLQVVNAIGDFFEKLFDIIPKLERKVKGLKNRIKGKKDQLKDSSKKLTIKKPSELQYCGKATLPDISKGLGVLIAVNEQTFGTYLDCLSDHYKSISGKSQSIIHEDLMGIIEKEDAVGIKRWFKEINKELARLIDITSRDPFSGDRVFMAVVKENGPLDSMKITRHREYTQINEAIDTELPNTLLVFSEFIEILHALIALSSTKRKLIKDLNEKYKQANVTLKKHMQGSLLHQVSKEELSKHHHAVFKQASKEYIKPIVEVSKANIRISTVLLSLVEEALGFYEDK